MLASQLMVTRPVAGTVTVPAGSSAPSKVARILYFPGAAHLFSGAGLSEFDDREVLFAEDGEAQLYGEEDDQQFGYDLAGGADLGGDGTPDILVGVPGYDGDLGPDAGLFGPVRGDPDMDEADLTLTGEATGDRFGQAVDAGGDFNGLGWEDLVVGAPGAGGGDGAVFVLALDRL